MIIIAGLFGQQKQTVGTASQVLCVGHNVVVER